MEESSRQQELTQRQGGRKQLMPSQACKHFLAELRAPEEAGEMSRRDKKFNHHTDDSGEPATARKTNVVSMPCRNISLEVRWRTGGREARQEDRSLGRS